MGQDSFIPVATNARARSDLVERGFTRQPLRVDLEVARTLEALAHAAWSIPRDQYYDGGDRYRSLNRVRAEIVEGGVKVWLSEESAPYVQLKNTTRQSAASRESTLRCPGDRRFHRGSQDDCSPPSLPTAVDGGYEVFGQRSSNKVHGCAWPAVRHEKYIATHLVGRCGAQGGEVVITDNDKQEMDRFTMRESGECYVFDDDRIWHMLTPVAVLEGNQYAFRDTLAFDMLPEGWEPVQ